MPKIPPQKYHQIIKKLRQFGFIYRRSAGSHEIWWNEILRKTCVVPHHREIKSGTVKSIIDQSGISPKEFFK